MFYCENCILATRDEICPNCGKKNLPKVRYNDPVFLTSTDAIWSGILEEVLQDGEIPYLKIGEQSTGVTLEKGSGIETYKFYVTFCDYDEAKDLLEYIFQVSISNKKNFS